MRIGLMLLSRGCYEDYIHIISSQMKIYNIARTWHDKEHKKRDDTYRIDLYKYRKETGKYLTNKVNNEPHYYELVCVSDIFDDVDMNLNTNPHDLPIYFLEKEVYECESDDRPFGYSLSFKISLRKESENNIRKFI